MRLTGICCLLMLSFASFSQSAGYKLLAGKSFVQSKNYYLLTLFEEIPEVRALLESDQILSGLAKTKNDSLALALRNCGSNAGCYTERFKFTEQEIAVVSERLLTLFQPENALGRLVKSHLIPSGTYVLFQSLTPKELLVKAWQQDANGINFAIGVYAQGNKANYPNIDSVSLPVKKPSYYNFAHTATYELAGSTASSTLFFTPSLAAALRFLEYNDRNQAGEYEPMTASVNKAAFDNIRRVNFSRYPYSLILVPGAGPDEKDIALSAEAIVRLRIAVLQYTKGMAPFILVSGGKVHPYKTIYNEALEMKRFLIEKMNIPESAILVDPHARHTTTNLRNTARIVFRYGIPFEKPILTSTSRLQSLMISNTLAARCKAELNEIPFRVGKRLSETAVEVFPLIDALQIDPEEPMDP